MKRLSKICAMALALTTILAPSALAAEWAGPSQVCYPTSVVQNEDGTEIRKFYDLSPEDDPAGIPRSDFEQDGFHYTMTDLLKQEMPEYESRQHTETVTLASKSKDMASVLALLPQEKEFITDDGLSGTLTLRLDTVQVEVSGYGSSTKEISATRTYPNLAGQDTQYIPKTIQDGGRTLTLQNISWQTDKGPHASPTEWVAWGEEEQGSERSFRLQAETELNGLCDDEDGYVMDDRYTAIATYTGSATSSYVTGYTVTADYTGTVSRIALNKTRYVAIFEGTPLTPTEPVTEIPDITEQPSVSAFHWAYVLIPLGVIAAAGGVIGIALFLKRRNELDEGGDEDE